MPGEDAAVSQRHWREPVSADHDKGVRKFTWKELSLLNQRHNAHVAYRGKVYNVSEFIARHPGGADQLMLGAGRDITQVFESYHPHHATKVMEKYYVGELVDNELPVFPKPGKFHTTLKKRVDDYFKENNIDPKVDYWWFFQYALFLFLNISSFVLTIYFHNNLLLSIPFAIGYGFFTAIVTMTLTHDASHFAITHRPWVWKMVGSVHDLVHGSSMFTWHHQHVLGHHPYTNIDGADPDISTAAGKVADIRRIKWSQKWLSRYFYQHAYVPVLYCLLGIKSRLQDFGILYHMKNSAVRLNRPSASQWAVFFAGKCIHVTYRIIIPAFFMPWYLNLALNAIGEICLSYWLAFIFQTSHVNTKAEWPKPDEDNVIHGDWAELQVATTQDYATDSWFWTVFTGALNHQTTHHLFPGVIQSHYRKITPIVRQTCEEFGIQYHYVETMTEALLCHVNHLKKLGQTVENSEQKTK